jgi:DNA repair protein RadC
MKSKTQLIKDVIKAKGFDHVSNSDIFHLLGYKGNDFYNSDIFKVIREVVKREPLPEVQKITCSKDTYNHLMNLQDLEHEEFHCILMNQNNRVINKLAIHKGGITSCVVDVRMIARLAIENKAINVIISHNHPSGNSYPSIADKDLTKKVKEGLKLLDINLIDHVIIAGGKSYLQNSYYSFADNGEL